jgi:prolyl-tRNA editing enzyme YbaK/EbsC (Cys-tRNA(Pro) deacylase)
VADVVKTLVVKAPPDLVVLVLVPGDRSLAWPKLRAVLGSNRCALPDAQTALALTGYERGTITPLGLDLPVIADERICGRHITLGSGRHGVAIALAADDLITAFSARVADVTTTETPD